MDASGPARETASSRPPSRTLASVTFRFYATLNDFLAPVRRQRGFAVPCPLPATTGQMIEALGVPQAEVALVVVNGEAAGFDSRLADGDRVAVYPAFASIDVTPPPPGECQDGGLPTPGAPPSPLRLSLRGAA